MEQPTPVQVISGPDGKITNESKESILSFLYTILQQIQSQNKTIDDIIDHSYLTREMNLTKTTTLPALLLQFKTSEAGSELMRKMLADSDKETLLRHQTAQSALQVASSTQEQLNLLRTASLDIIKRNNYLEKETGRLQHEKETMEIELNAKLNLIKQYEAIIHEIQSVMDEPSNEASTIADLNRHIKNLNLNMPNPPGA